MRLRAGVEVVMRKGPLPFLGLEPRRYRETTQCSDRAAAVLNSYRVNFCWKLSYGSEKLVVNKV